MCKRVDICNLMFLVTFLSKYGYSRMIGCLIGDLYFFTSATVEQRKIVSLWGKGRSPNS